MALLKKISWHSVIEKVITAWIIAGIPSAIGVGIYISVQLAAIKELAESVGNIATSVHINEGRILASELILTDWGNNHIAIRTELATLKERFSLHSHDEIAEFERVIREYQQDKE